MLFYVKKLLKLHAVFQIKKGSVRSTSHSCVSHTNNRVTENCQLKL